MSVNVYESLRSLLDCHPFGCPSSPEIIEILKILFSEDEAKVALGLGFVPFTAEEIAQRSGLDLPEVKQRIESLASKGLVFAREKDGVWKYALFDTIRLFENPFRKGGHDETIDKLIPLTRQYATTKGKSFNSPTSVFRIIPIQEKIESISKVLPYEKVYEMIDRAKSVGISRCTCRELEQKCDAPRETCMIFDATCDFLVGRGFARYLTKEEMKHKVHEFAKAGLVLQVNNTQDKLHFICSCCPCCCIVLRAFKNYGNPRMLTRSAFKPIRIPENCAGCGTCAEVRCPMGAISIVDKTPVMNIDLCIGCGLCVTGCPNNAIRLEKEIEVPEPPANEQEMGLRILQARGKLLDFAKVITPKGKSPLIIYSLMLFLSNPSVQWLSNSYKKIRGIVMDQKIL